MVPVGIFFGFIFYLIGDLRFFCTWVIVPGYFGSVALYIFPWLAAFMQILVIDGGSVSAAPGAYLVTIVVTGMLIWLINGLFHVAFAARLLAYGNANGFDTREEKWVCDLDQGDMTDEEYDLQCAAIKLATKKNE